MGKGAGGGGLRLLPHKSWNVYNKDARRRVQRDEAQQRQRDAQLAQRRQQDEHHHRLDSLRRRHQHSSDDDSDDKAQRPSTANPPPSSSSALPSSHVHLFPDPDASAALLTAQRDEQRQRKADELSAAQRIAPSSLFGSVVHGPTPWYLRTDEGLRARDPLKDERKERDDAEGDDDGAAKRADLVRRLRERAVGGHRLPSSTLLALVDRTVSASEDPLDAINEGKKRLRESSEPSLSFPALSSASSSSLSRGDEADDAIVIDGDQPASSSGRMSPSSSPPRSRKRRQHGEDDEGKDRSHRLRSREDSPRRPSRSSKRVFRMLMQASAAVGPAEPAPPDPSVARREQEERARADALVKRQRDPGDEGVAEVVGYFNPHGYTKRRV